MEINQITAKIIGCAIEVHRQLGPGLLESAYEACLKYELIKTGLQVHQQVSLPLTYKDVEMDIGYRLDLLIENKVLVEVKSVTTLLGIHEAQVLTYLKLSDTEVGLLINFNVVKLVNGVKRLIAKE